MDKLKQGAVVSHRYATENLLKTIETVLGLPPIGLNDALAEPMSEVFDPAVDAWSFEPTVPDVLRKTALPLPTTTIAAASCPPATRSASYWRAAMAGQDFAVEDHLDTVAFNLALWRGLKGDAPYPTVRDGRDLRESRAFLLAAEDTATDNRCVRR